MGRHSLLFGDSGDENSLGFCSPLFMDVNADKSRDLICFFYTGKTGFQCGDTEGLLTKRPAFSPYPLTFLKIADKFRISAPGRKDRNMIQETITQFEARIKEVSFI